MAAMNGYLATANYRYLSGQPDRQIRSDLMSELDESDVWNVSVSPEFIVHSPQISKKSSPTTAKRATALSVPVDVPDWSRILKEDFKENRWSGSEEGSFDEDFSGAGNRIPPHEFLAKARIASFSVHEGIGRTLKGRDLSRVRNAVWEKIGFED